MKVDKESLYVMGLSTAYLFAISATTILLKIQDVTTGKDGRKFEHPYWQSFMSTVSEVSILFIYFAQKLCRRKQ